jgi:non-ribosomal peptide synthetase component F
MAQELERQTGWVPIGVAIPGNELFLLTDRGSAALVSPSDLTAEVSGEICVGGAGLAVGYWGAPEATREAFPTLCRPAGGREWRLCAGGACGHEQERRVYRSGDLAVWSGQLLHYTGRKDRVIKRNGQRVDLGRVEDALMRCEGVAEAAVVLLTTAEQTTLAAVVALR